MTTGPFTRVLVGYVPTEQGADARALGVDLAAASGADLLLVSVVAAVWIEHIGEQTGPAVVHRAVSVSGPHRRSRRQPPSSPAFAGSGMSSGGSKLRARRLAGSMTPRCPSRPT